MALRHNTRDPEVGSLSTPVGRVQTPLCAACSTLSSSTLPLLPSLLPAPQLPRLLHPPPRLLFSVCSVCCALSLFLRLLVVALPLLVRRCDGRLSEPANTSRHHFLASLLGHLAPVSPLTPVAAADPPRPLPMSGSDDDDDLPLARKKVAPPSTSSPATSSSSSSSSSSKPAAHRAGDGDDDDDQPLAARKASTSKAAAAPNRVSAPPTHSSLTHPAVMPTHSHLPCALSRACRRRR